MLQRLLIANRGEIACRIQRTCRELGIETVAVFSEVDRHLPHVQQADLSVCLGAAEARDSYLSVERIIDAARRTGAQAIHPGYGFLSENAAFAEACSQAGITFIGPPAECIRLMGDKAAARREMAQSGVPVLPGYDGNEAGDERLEQEAARVGYPLLIKAVAGGGGKGMRIVHSSEEFSEALEAARREATGAFGDARMLLERYLARARHVEVQVFADEHDNAVYLFERDCSVQRRHQKIVEEAPAPGVDAALRKQLGEAAVRAARAIGYRGAGTVEFLLAPDGEFFFMEMNTRLQVEHPVTELVTGEDLVAWQLRVASGEPLPRAQQELRLEGHAMEVRLYAENPLRSFMPSSGTLAVQEWPQQTGVRIDSGFNPGNPVTRHYDPMLAKVIAHGKDREQARLRLIRALEHTLIGGIQHNTGFLADLLAHPRFAAAELSTRFLEDYPEAGQHEPAARDTLFCAAALFWREQLLGKAWQDPWQRNDGWRGALPPRFTGRLALDDDTATLSVRAEGGEAFEVTLEREPRTLTWHPTAGGGVIATEEDSALAVQGRIVGDELYLFVRGHSYRFKLQPPALALAHAKRSDPFAAPMSGTLVACHAGVGQRVEAGDAVVTMEAMKMEHTLRAPAPGIVTALPWTVGDTVTEGTPLAEFTADEDGEQS